MLSVKWYVEVRLHDISPIIAWPEDVGRRVGLETINEPKVWQSNVLSHLVCHTGWQPTLRLECLTTSRQKD